MTVQSSASREAHEEVCPLGVAGGSYHNGAGGSLLQRVVVSFLNLGILAELEAAGFGVVNGKAGDNLEWSEVASSKF